ncbi:hypothetical protein [Lentzea sp. CA-135723]|uniref:hypothetical protein n=1 Tax=Lentzea sp. CA-135723 TaxID=3239950 RepID=UPI003D9334A4
MGDDDHTDDWSTQTVSLHVDADVATTARLVQERLGIALTKTEGREHYSGLDASGVELSVFGSRQILPGTLLGEVDPERASIYVRHTTVGHAIVEALSGPPFHLNFIAPRSTAADQRRDAAWDRVLSRLTGEGWQAHLIIDGPPAVLQGHLPTGDEFELKCRGDRVVFYVDEVSGALHEEEIDYPDAGFIEPDEALRVLRDLHQRWLTRRP